MRHADGTVHFSTLKKLALSPAHYRVACESETDPSRGMRIGTGSHFLLLGPREGQRVVCFPGEDRRSKGWKDFAAENDGADILTLPEWSECESIAKAVLADPVAGPMLAAARKEVPLKWTSAGLPCSTSGVDLVGPGWLAELKTTTTTEPTAWARQALRMHYHCQLAWYEEGARANGIDVSGGLWIIGVEIAAPWAVTCFELTEGTILAARKSVGLWLEKLRACELNNSWPTYTQTAIPLDLPVWMTDETEADDGEEAA